MKQPTSTCTVMQSYISFVRAPEQLHKRGGDAASCLSCIACLRRDARRSHSNGKAVHLKAATEHRLGQSVQEGALVRGRNARNSWPNVRSDDLRTVAILSRRMASIITQ